MNLLIKMMKGLIHKYRRARLGNEGSIREDAVKRGTADEIMKEILE